MGEQMKITKAGQVSIPAAIRRRWGASKVMVEDGGDHIVLRPAPDDPLKAVRGSLAEEIRRGPSLEESRRRFREEEAEIEEAKLRRYRRGR